MRRKIRTDAIHLSTLQSLMLKSSCFNLTRLVHTSLVQESEADSTLETIGHLLKSRSRRKVLFHPPEVLISSPILEKPKEIPDLNFDGLSGSEIGQYAIEHKELLFADASKTCKVAESMLDQNFFGLSAWKTISEGLRKNRDSLNIESLVRLLQKSVSFSIPSDCSFVFNILSPFVIEHLNTDSSFEIVEIAMAVSSYESKITKAQKQQILKDIAEKAKIILHRMSATDIFRLFKILKNESVLLDEAFLRGIARKLQKAFSTPLNDKHFIATSKSAILFLDYLSEHSIDKRIVSEFKTSAQLYFENRYKLMLSQSKTPSRFNLFKYCVMGLSKIDQLEQSYIDGIIELFFYPSKHSRFTDIMHLKDLLFFLDIIRQSPDSMKSEAAQGNLISQIENRVKEASVDDMFPLLQYLGKWNKESAVEPRVEEIETDNIIRAITPKVIEIFKWKEMTASEAISLLKSFSLCDVTPNKKLRLEFSKFLGERITAMDSKEVTGMLEILTNLNILDLKIASTSAEHIVANIENIELSNMLTILSYFSSLKVRNELLFFKVNSFIKPRLHELSDTQIALLCDSFFTVGITSPEIFAEARKRLLDRSKNWNNVDSMTQIVWACAGGNMMDRELVERSFEILQNVPATILHRTHPAIRRNYFQALSFYLSSINLPFSFTWEIDPQPPKEIIPFLKECADASFAHQTAPNKEKLMEQVFQTLKGVQNISNIQRDTLSPETYGYEFQFIFDYQHYFDDEPMKIALEITTLNAVARGRSTLLGSALLRQNIMKQIGYKVVQISASSLTGKQVSVNSLRDILVNEIIYVVEAGLSMEEDDPNAKWEKLMRKAAKARLESK